MGKLRRQYHAMTRGIRHFLVYSVFHANDPPHRLALGVALGMFITFTPTFGMQMVLVAFGAWVLSANKVVGLPVVWLSNPATMVPIYYWCFQVGRSIVGHQGMGKQWWQEFSSPPAGWWPRVQFYWSELVEIAIPLWLGSIVIGFATAIPTYYVVYYIVRGYRLRRWGQITPPRDEPVCSGAKAVGMQAK